VINKNKTIYLTVTTILPVLIFITGIVWILLRQDLVVFPNTDFTEYPYTDEHDKVSKGNSRIDEFKILPDKLIVSYTLKEGTQYPYAGININRRGSFFDISGYSDLKIEIRATRSERLRIFILLYIDGITDNSDFLTYLYLYKEIPLWQNKAEYNLPLKDFFIPEWWYDINNISENDARIKKDFSKTFTLQIERGIALPLDVTDTIVLQGLSFSVDKAQSILFSCIFLASYFLVFTICVLWKANKNRMVAHMRQLIIPYKYLEIEKELDPDTRKIIEYLVRNYQTPDLSVKKVGAACFVPAYKIPVILKEKFQLSFNGYINFLRLNEAKRLLKETDSSITDIAMNTGYNNISHFNNLFKFIEGVSPREFRKKSRE
jgi:AraC-like DNA-binding protein